MKRNNSIQLILIFLFSIAAYTYAQSDYETVQKFKKRVNEVEQQIKDADSLGTISEIQNNIDKINNDFASQKQLLDKSLYPENFAGTIDRLKNSAQLREGDFTRITELHTKVIGLQTQIDTLNRRNNELAQQFALLESQNKEDISRLENTINQLRASLQRRDQIVMNMIDSLLPASYRHGGELSTSEQQQLVSKAERDNVLSHIKRAVNDNIRFLEATKLYPQDLSKVKDQQERFTQIWKSVGPTMVEVYSQRKKGTNDLKEIDESFTAWNTKINQEVWESIKDEFAVNNISLRDFSNGTEFTNSLKNYITDATQNAERINKDRAEAEYKNFADSTWDEKIKPSWVPFLIDNNMLAENQEDSIEVLLASWKDTVSTGGINITYIILGVLVLGVILFFIFRKSPGRTAEA